MDIDRANAILDDFDLPALENQGGALASYGERFRVQVDPRTELADVVLSGDGEAVTDELTRLGFAEAAEIAMLLNDQRGPWYDRVAGRESSS